MTKKYIFLFLFSLLMTAGGLASMPPLDRDEPRFVQATKQMAETGNYVDIRFQDTRATRSRSESTGCNRRR